MTTILIVEDNLMVQEILAERLAMHGFETTVAGNGRQGIETAVRQKPDLILMDMNLPDMDGWRATRELKGNRETAVIPIIALTAYALPADRQKSEQAGCDAYETKPINFPHLLQTMAQLLTDKT
ncbi:MAG: response regulator [Anaerolineae bacterium]